MKGFNWNLLYSELVTGFVMLNFMLCLWMYVKLGVEYCYFLTMMWMIIIYILVWNSIYRKMEDNRRMKR